MWLTPATTISVAVVPLTGVSIDGPTTGTINSAYAFTATVSPPTATLPFTYSWSPVPESGQGTKVVTYTWSTLGIQTISITAANAGGVTVADTHFITIHTVVYLPVILK